MTRKVDDAAYLRGLVARVLNLPRLYRLNGEWRSMHGKDFFLGKEDRESFDVIIPPDAP